MTQRQVGSHTAGSHTASFSRAPKAALREDPDIVLVGEMRDLETVSLALETANTGHLVLGTLHTSTAVGAIDRIVDMFPAERQNQVRSGLADSLVGVVVQTLYRRMGGGRVAGLEVLVVNPAVSNWVREGENFQIANIMQTGKAQGNMLPNDSLAELGRDRKVSPEEAMGRAVDKPDLTRRLGQLGVKAA